MFKTGRAAVVQFCMLLHMDQICQIEFPFYIIQPKIKLENCPWLRIEVSSTTFRPLALTFHVCAWPLTLIFNPRRAMVMTHTHAKA